MSPQSFQLTANELIKITESKGFYFVRQKGSHMRYKNNNGAKIAIPNHGSKQLHPKIVKNVLQAVGIL